MGDQSDAIESHRYEARGASTTDENRAMGRNAALLLLGREGERKSIPREMNERRRKLGSTKAEDRAWVGGGRGVGGWRDRDRLIKLAQVDDGIKIGRGSRRSCAFA